MNSPVAPPPLLLSILVPTWNRVDDLRRLVPRLLTALREYPEIEVLISSNGSTDSTREFLDSVPAQERLRIVHQPVNCGPSIHAGWLYAHARARFLWLFGDDDLFEPGLPGAILRWIRADPELGWIHLPHRFPQAQGPDVLSRMPEADVRVARGRDAFAPYVMWISFTSSNVIRSGLLHACLPQQNLSTGWWPMQLLMRSVADAPAVVLACRGVIGGPEISWRESWLEHTHFGYPLEILNSPVLTLAEKRACLRQRYSDWPNSLERLVVINPRLLLRLLRTEPRLLRLILSPSLFRKLFQGRIWGKSLRLITGTKRPSEEIRS